MRHELKRGAGIACALGAAVSLMSSIAQGAPGFDVAPPVFSRLVIGTDGASTLEGRGSPGSQIVIHRNGKVIAATVVDRGGAWSVTIAGKLAAGEHRLASAASLQNDVVYGDEVRISVPEALTAPAVFTYEERSAGARAAYEGTISARRRAEELAEAASKRFSQIMGRKDHVQVAQGPGPEIDTMPLRRHESGEEDDSPLVQWLERAARTYQREIVGKLSAPAETGGGGARDPARGDDPAGERRGVISAPAEGSTSSRSFVQRWVDEIVAFFAGGSEEDVAGAPASEPGAGDEGRFEVAERQTPKSSAADRKAETERRTKEYQDRIQESLKKFDETLDEKGAAVPPRDAAEEEARRKEEEAIRAREAERKAEIERRKKENEKRILEGLKKLEDAKKAEEEKKIVAARRAAEAEREAEADRAGKEMRRAAMAQRMTAEAEAEQKAAEAKYAAEEARRAEDERRIAAKADDDRKAEADRQAAEKDRAAAEAQRLAEVARKAEEAAAARQAAEDARRTEAAKRMTAEAEQARMAAEAKLAAEEERKAAEDKRREAQAEEQRLAAEMAAEAERGAEEEALKAEDTARSLAAVAPSLPPEVHREAVPAADAEASTDVAEPAEEVRPQVAEAAHEAAPLKKRTAERGRKAKKASSHRARKVRASRKARIAGWRAKQAAHPSERRHRKAHRHILKSIHVVRRGDTLWGIANRYFNCGRRYAVIYRANRGKIRNPDLIYPGQRLHIPRIKG